MLARCGKIAMLAAMSAPPHATKITTVLSTAAKGNHELVCSSWQALHFSSDSRGVSERALPRGSELANVDKDT